MTQLQQKLTPEKTTDKRHFEVAILEALEIEQSFDRLAKKEREAEKNPARTDVTKDLTEKEQRFIKAVEQQYEQLKKEQKPLPNDEKMREYIDKYFTEKQSRERLYNHYKVEPEQEFVLS